MACVELLYLQLLQPSKILTELIERRGLSHYSPPPQLSGQITYSPPPPNHGKYTIMRGGYIFMGGYNGKDPKEVLQ